jgi:hypothetical protein
VTRRLAYLFLLVAAACTEQSTAPGNCPNFCPGGTIDVHDTIFTSIIERDSSFRGYVPGFHSQGMPVADVPGSVESRAIVATDTMIRRVAPKVGDTTTVPIGVDSTRVRFVIVRRPKNTTNVRLRLYALPLTVDSTSDFASLDPSFSAPAVDSMNVSALLALPAIGDTQTVRLWGDSIRTDSAGHVLQINATDSSLIVFFTLDTLQAPFSVPDTGRLAFGVRVAADSLASITLGTTETAGNGPVVRFFYHYTVPDTVSATPDSVAYSNRTVGTRFDGFVFNPATAPSDSNLAVGGVPSARSLLRVAMPKFLHDSIDVVRATLILVPVNAVPGAVSDSFQVLSRALLTDLGAKSPINSNSALFANTVIHIGSSDTVRVELTNLVRAWSLDTTLVTSFMLVQAPEAATYTEIRFYSSRAPAFRPALQVTYVKRFRFGEP